MNLPPPLRPELRCGGSTPGWAGVFDELCALGGEVVVCGAPALGYYRPGNAVDLVYLCAPRGEAVVWRAERPAMSA